MVTYTYSIAGDFPGSWISLTSLTFEIIDDVAILGTIKHISNEEDVVDIVFYSSLTAPEITALDSIVASHNNSWIQTQGYSGIPHAALLDVGTTTHSGIDTHIVTVDAHHNRLHTVTSTVDHTAENWKVLYTDGSGNVQELALGADGESFISNGPASAPYFTTISGTGGVGFGDDLCAIQICRSTNFSVTGAAWQDVPFDITDIENDATVLEHDDVNTDRIKIKEDGLYFINYETSLDLNGEDGDDDFWLRVIKNDTTEIPGGQVHLNDSGDTHTHSNTFVAEFLSGDFITLQVKNNVTTATLEAGATFKVVCLRGTDGADGAEGATGPPGAGSTVNVYDDGTPVDGTPFGVLNFDGATISGSPTISGGVDITVSAEDHTHTESDITDLDDYATSEELATTSGTLQDQIDTHSHGSSSFGSEFHQAVSEGESSTTSESYQQKVRLTTGTLVSGTYMIQWNFEFDGGGDAGHARVELNDTDELGYNYYDSSLSNYIHIGGFALESLSGVNTVDIDWRSQSSSNSMDIRRARITLWRVS